MLKTIIEGVPKENYDKTLITSHNDGFLSSLTGEIARTYIDYQKSTKHNHSKVEIGLHRTG